jgi:hypothetical protein
MAEYVPGHPVTVRIRQRGSRYDFDDGGAAVALAGRPAGWLAASQAVVAEDSLNINRSGVVFVQGFEGRDLGRLERKVARTSRAVYLALLEREG